MYFNNKEIINMKDEYLYEYFFFVCYNIIKLIYFVIWSIIFENYISINKLFFRYNEIIKYG